MGIDVYLNWEGQTEAEKQLQFTGCSILHGHVGYLREAYRGGPYATMALMPEAFSAEDPAIDAAVLKDRLDIARQTCRQRYEKIYPGKDPSGAIRSLDDFVALAERKQQETGRPCTVHVSA